MQPLEDKTKWVEMSPKQPQHSGARSDSKVLRPTMQRTGMNYSASGERGTEMSAPGLTGKIGERGMVLRGVGLQHVTLAIRIDSKVLLLLRA